MSKPPNKPKFGITKKNKPKAKKKVKKLAKLKKEVKKIKKEWNKAIHELETFDPLKDMEIPDFSKQLEGSGFKIRTDCDI